MSLVSIILILITLTVVLHPLSCMELYKNQSGDSEPAELEQACSKPAVPPTFLAA